MTFENAYYNSTTSRSYKQLDNYYKAADFFDKDGYYSSQYGLTYYDGYGYNYYT